MNEEAIPNHLEETVLLNDFPFFVSLGRLNYWGDNFAIDGIFSFKVQTETAFTLSEWPFLNMLVVGGSIYGSLHCGSHNNLAELLAGFGVIVGIFGFRKCLYPKKRLLLKLKTGKTVKTRWGAWDKQEKRFKALEEALNKAIGLQTR